MRFTSRLTVQANAVLALCASGASAQTAASWQTTATPWRANQGETLRVYCPPSFVPGGTVWGSISYTDDSSICMAAVHSLVSFDHVRGGTVLFTMEQGRGAYAQDTSRGVITNSYGPWNASFRIVGAYNGKQPAEVNDSTPLEITWRASAAHWRGLDSAIRIVQCPSSRVGGLIWGRDIYADESAICPAAVHAGLIKLATGGTVTLRIDPALEKYAGGVRHSIRSDSTSDKPYGSFSFPKEQVKLTRLRQGDDALPVPRAGVGMVIEAQRYELEMVRVDGSIAGYEIRPPVAQLPPPPPQEESGEFNVTWTQNATTWRGQRGRMLTLFCPPGGAPGKLWGSGEYTDDSSVCTAAVHSLETFDFARGGTVFFSMTEGRDNYPSESRRGVASDTWQKYESSFFIVGGVPDARPNDVKDSTVIEIGWATTAEHLRGKTGERTVVCPRDYQPFPVWGDSVYNDLSSICGAAVHRGAITRSGGRVAVKIEAKRASYKALKRFEITSLAMGAGQGSFTVRKK
ncbi:MAG TPA: LCCL domain-containing protein [Gemmatimonadaceae bacterium]|nr:LCCL domain-containing protein [Gemmatimonadaceae bacterium]